MDRLEKKPLVAGWRIKNKLNKSTSFPFNKHPCSNRYPPPNKPPAPGP